MIKRTKIIFYLFLFLMFLASCSKPKSKFNFDKLLWTVDWSPDNKYIAVGGNTNYLKLLSTKDLSVVKEIKKPNTITKIKWHPNEKILAHARQGGDESDSNSRSAEIINIETNTTISLDVHNARGLGWNKSGNRLALGDGEGVLRIYSKNGDLIKRIDTDQKAIIGLSWHPDEDRVVTIGSHIEIINIESEKRIKIIPREIEILMLCVEWHPSGDFFVTGDYGDFTLDYPPLLMFWNKGGEKIREILGSKAEYRNLKWTQNGNILATASDKVRTWTKEGKLIKERNLGSNLWGIDWNNDYQKIVTTSEDGKVFILDRDLNL